MNDKGKQCVPGCKYFYGSEIRHHQDCPFYPESFTEMYDKLIQKLDKAENYTKILEDDKRAFIIDAKKELDRRINEELLFHQLCVF